MTQNPDKASDQKQAACLECRKSKTKCIRTLDEATCRKCRASGVLCEIPAYHVGRHKGVKNKRSGLEKSISQVQRAIKRFRKSDSTLEDDEARALEHFLRDTAASAEESSNNTTSHLQNEEQRSSAPPSQQRKSISPQFERDSSDTQQFEDPAEETVDNAGNPLQLLACVSAVGDPLSTSTNVVNAKGESRVKDTTTHARSDSQAFFRPLKTKLDIGPDVDPIELGLVTEDEAERLFAFFHQQLAHTRWGMDPTLHTHHFVRSRSASLLTSVLAAAALFLPDTGALAKRLHNHLRKLVQNLMLTRHRSVEIVLALLVSVPWMAPGREWASEDDTCYFISLAVTIALDLSMNKMITPITFAGPNHLLDHVPKTDCIEASRALQLDGYNDLNPQSVSARRILRTRERIWLALFNLDRGVCLARGRPSTVPASPLIYRCESWCISDIAVDQDGALISSTALRRDFLSLVNSVRDTCDTHQLIMSDDPSTIKELRDRIEDFFGRWEMAWIDKIRQRDGRIPPYVEILASHTKLSAYCSVIGHPTAPSDVKRFFRAAGFDSAFNVLRVAVQAEKRLASMPNNTVIMVSFAACFVLGLSTTKLGGILSIASNIRDFIEKVVKVLHRIGSTPEHRNGASMYFAKHIEDILKRLHSESVAPTQNGDQTLVPEYQQTDAYSASNNALGDSIFSFGANDDASNVVLDNFPSLGMTNDQIIEAIVSSTDDDDGGYNQYFNFDEDEFLNWAVFPG